MENSGAKNAKLFNSTKTMIGGLVMLIIAMGIGRFSYTSIDAITSSSIRYGIRIFGRE
ncbi:hypothetical protein ACYCS5_27745 [Paenibacillus sp. SEL3]|uniref:hypothetical protein n=1 Tax=Paenibacillus TaxID=44249 RepID=UPI0039BC9E21